MLAVDTNVVVRYLTDDDAAQSPIARRLVDANEVRVSWTVLLESEWVLRSAHKLSRETIGFILRQFAGLPNVRIDHLARFRDALAWFGQGMDFADALHLATCAGEDTFATFDRRLVASARKVRAGKVRAL